MIFSPYLESVCMHSGLKSTIKTRQFLYLPKYVMQIFRLANLINLKLNTPVKTSRILKSYRLSYSIYLSTEKRIYIVAIYVFYLLKNIVAHIDNTFRKLTLQNDLLIFTT